MRVSNSLKKSSVQIPLEGHLLAAKKSSVAPRRISFAKIREPLEVPNLLALQVESVDWLLGNENGAHV